MSRGAALNNLKRTLHGEDWRDARVCSIVSHFFLRAVKMAVGFHVVLRYCAIVPLPSFS